MKQQPRGRKTEKAILAEHKKALAAKNRWQQLNHAEIGNSENKRRWTDVQRLAKKHRTGDNESN